MAFDSSREVSIRTIVLPWKKKALPSGYSMMARRHGMIAASHDFAGSTLAAFPSSL
jgi:hypothetical protein